MLECSTHVAKTEILYRGILKFHRECFAPRNFRKRFSAIFFHRFFENLACHKSLKLWSAIEKSRIDILNPRAGRSENETNRNQNFTRVKNKKTNRIEHSKRNSNISGISKKLHTFIFEIVEENCKDASMENFFLVWNFEFSLDFHTHQQQKFLLRKQCICSRSQNFQFWTGNLKKLKFWNLWILWNPWKSKHCLNWSH